MELLLPFLVNVVYGFLFFVAFGVLIGTTILFAMATWDKVILPLLGVVRRSRQP